MSNWDILFSNAKCPFLTYTCFIICMFLGKMQIRSSEKVEKGAVWVM